MSAIPAFEIGVWNAWILLLFAILWLATGFILANPEELDCLKKYGDSYRQYMNRTPRWIVR